jgi:hypothetical protein
MLEDTWDDMMALVSWSLSQIELELESLLEVLIRLKI